MSDFFSMKMVNLNSPKKKKKIRLSRIKNFNLKKIFKFFFLFTKTYRSLKDNA